VAERRLPVYLSLEEAAEVMSLSVKTIRRRIADGTIPAYQCGRRPIRIRLDELEAALRRIPFGPVVSTMNNDDHGASADRRAS
jgi:excisionase family DNA binding protein